VLADADYQKGYFIMKKFNVTVNGNFYEVEVEEVTGTESAEIKPVVKSAVKSAPAAVGGTSVTAPMPGTVLDIKVAVGDTVKRGQTVVVLEAMKMENDIVAPCDGKIVKINTTKGSQVGTSDVLAIVQ
jgi:biotin carboxyl carrier protein